MTPRWTALTLAVLLAPLAACAQDDGLTLPDPTPERLDSLARAVVAELVPVAGGTFEMGDAGARYIVLRTGAVDSLRGDPEQRYWAYGSDDEPVHTVELSDYAVQPYEVTYGGYDLFTQATGRPPASPALRQRPRDVGSETYSDIRPPDRTPRHPVGVDTRDEAQAYCLWLGELTGLPFDLPTEAQWEYAARSRGRNVPFATDTGVLDEGRNIRLSDPMHDARVIRGEMGEADFDSLRESITTEAEPVGTYPPNPLGLYDMSANTFEVVRDWYDAGYYAASPRRDPQGPATGDRWTIRGGTNAESIGASTTVGRYSLSTVSPRGEPTRSGRFGFRCAVNASVSLRGSTGSETRP